MLKMTLCRLTAKTGPMILMTFQIAGVRSQAVSLAAISVGIVQQLVEKALESLVASPLLTTRARPGAMDLVKESQAARMDHLIQLYLLRTVSSAPLPSSRLVLAFLRYYLACLRTLAFC